MDWTGQRVLVMGLGLHGGGVAAAQHAARRGAVVTVTDLADQHALTESVEALAGTSIAQWRLGGHADDDFRTADLVVVNPAVRPGNPLVEIARRGGARITSEIELTLDACRAPVIGVTGTTGKSTTAAMIAEILRADAARCGPRLAAGHRRVWLGGNIGTSLLPEIDQIGPDDRVVLELSSFQLYWLDGQARWPRVAVVTNFSPHHLDWHGASESYAAAKRRLLERLPEGGIAVVDLDDLVLARWCETLPAPPWPLVDDAEIPPLRVPGAHNRHNARLAATAAVAAGASQAAVAQGLSGFGGLPHRLQWAGELSGRPCYDDSKATSPAAAIAGLQAMDRPTWVLLGGAAIQADFASLAAAVTRQARGAALFGAAGPLLREALLACDSGFCYHCAPTLDDALAWCCQRAQPGDAILLSPACPSYDQFRDFAHRGQRFQQLVRQWA